MVNVFCLSIQSPNNIVRLGVVRISKKKVALWIGKLKKNIYIKDIRACREEVGRVTLCIYFFV